MEIYTSLVLAGFTLWIFVKQFETKNIFVTVISTTLSWICSVIFTNQLTLYLQNGTTVSITIPLTPIFYATTIFSAIYLFILGMYLIKGENV